LGAKKTSDLIPLCHPLSLTKVNVSCKLSNDDTNRILIECEAR
jgi:molybdenum cofactor biosynthesis enzyme